MTRPIIKTVGSAGADLSIPKDVWLMPFQTKLVMTEYEYDVRPELLNPDGTVHRTNFKVHTDVRPRSSVSRKGILIHLGLIDSDYVGNTVGVIMTNLTPFPKQVKAGRVAQLVVTLNCTAAVFSAEANEREGGFGSTGV